MTNNEKDTVVSVRIPDSWVNRLDEDAVRLAQSIGTKIDRSDILRIALSRYLGFISEEAKPAPSQ